MQSYYIYILPESKFIKVAGKKIIIKGFEEFDFFVHRSYNSESWKVSEGISGASITSIGGERLRKDAIDKAETNLSDKSKDEIIKLISEFVEKCGVSPRYLDRCLPEIKGGK